jgi:hypothetical protein
MQVFSRVAVAAALLAGCSMFAKADTILWTLNDVTFTDGNTATGWFVTDATNLTDVESYSLQVTGPDLSRDFVANAFQTADLPDEISIGRDPGYSPYTDLNLVGGLTSAGGIVHLQANNGFDCPGCGVVVIESDTYVDGVINGLPPTATPEPSTVPFLTAGAVGIVFLVRRKLARAN